MRIKKREENIKEKFWFSIYFSFAARRLCADDDDDDLIRAFCSHQTVCCISFFLSFFLQQSFPSFLYFIKESFKLCAFSLGAFSACQRECSVRIVQTLRFSPPFFGCGSLTRRSGPDFSFFFFSFIYFNGERANGSCTRLSTQQSAACSSIAVA